MHYAKSIRFSLHKTDISHTKLCTMDIDTWDHPPITQKSYNLPLKHTPWVWDEEDMLQETENMS